NKGQGQSKIGEIKKELLNNGLTDKNPFSFSPAQGPFGKAEIDKGKYKVPEDSIDTSSVGSAKDAINRLEIKYKNLAAFSQRPEEPSIAFSRRIEGDGKVAHAQALEDNNNKGLSR
ncbi:hypothetical protein N9R48_02730, partial [Rickettsiales bacterium]|nr:hypothetical protein [Rickettsiales bacterium]